MAGKNKTIELIAEGEELKDLIKIFITKISEECGECGHVVVKKPYGTVFIPRLLGMPEKITIQVRRKEE